MSQLRTPHFLRPLALAILLSLLLPAHGSLAAHPPAQTHDLSDTQALEHFFDGLAAAQRAAYPVAGMTISVVKDGQIIFAKGYGYASVEAGIPVDAATTLFRAGSVSKLFVWTAMMQQVEAGALNLDVDVNSYLDFEIPPAFGRRITLRNLMTHTPGFEDQGLGLFLSAADQVAPLGQYLAENVPARVFPPGEISAYSNYGASLAAYIVQRVSGMPFDQYVEQHIFAPLGMEHSTFRQPLPPHLADNLAEGYLYNQGRFEEGIFEFVQSYPAGSLSTTSTDMGRFMIAHLQNGRFNEGRILQEETARQMREVAFTHDPRLPGWGAGFTVAQHDGQHVVGHGGDTTYFHNELALLPDHNVGLFVSTNSDGGTLARFHLVQAFLQRYFPERKQPQPAPAPEFLQRAEKYTGVYYPARMNVTGIEKILSLLQPVQVQTTAGGLLSVAGLIGSTPTYWVEHSPHLFEPFSENLPHNVTLLFQPDDQDATQIQYLFFEQSAYIKQPPYASPTLHFTLLGVSLLAFLSIIVALPAGALTHRRYQRAAPQLIAPQPPPAHAARWLAWALALVNLVFLVGFVLIVGDLNNVVFGLPPILQALLLLPSVSAVLWLSTASFTVLAWLKRYWTLWGRIVYTLFAVIALAYLMFLWFWNFL